MQASRNRAQGSDLSAVRTRIEVTDSHFNVTGQKFWSSFAHIAMHCILVGRSDPDSESHAGLTYLIVDMKSPGSRCDRCARSRAKRSSTRSSSPT